MIWGCIYVDDAIFLHVNFWIKREGAVCHVQLGGRVQAVPHTPSLKSQNTTLEDTPVSM